MLNVGDKREPVPRLWPFLLLCAVVAVWIDFGAYHGHHHSDSLIPVLTCTQRWTPFFWFQNRIGMLVPLLSLPVQDPLANLLVQNAMYVFCGLAALFLLARYVLRDAAYPVVGAVSAVAFLTLAPSAYRFNYFSSTFYGVWIALGLGGLILLEPLPDGTIPRGRRVLALFLFALAHWVYLAAIVLFVPLVVLRHLLFHPRDETAEGLRPPLRTRLRLPAGTEAGVSLRLVAGGAGVGLALMAIGAVLPFPHYYTGFGLIWPTEWPAAWQRLTENTWSRLAPYYWPTFLAVMAGVGLLLVAVPAARRLGINAWRAVVVLIGTAVVYVFLMCTLLWLKEPGDYDDRYAIPAVIVLQAAFTIAGVAPLCAALGGRARKVLYALTFPALLLAALFSYGFPSLALVRAGIDRTLGQSTDDIVEAGCTHIAGEYWWVWPRVFHANLVLHERGQERQVWGVTYRTDVTRHLWSGIPLEQTCVAVPLEDNAEARSWLEHFGFKDLRPAERRPTVLILRP